MVDSTPLMEKATAFSRALSPAVKGQYAEGPELETRLWALTAEARSRWPGIVIDDSVWLEHLAGCTTSDHPLETLHASDLYLALGAALGVPAGANALETAHLAELTNILTRLGYDHSSSDEAVQVLRQRLLLRTPESRPRLFDFRGHGALRMWLRMAAIRQVLSLKRAHPEADSLDDERWLQLAEPTDPQLRILSQQYAGHFRAAFREALGELSREERLAVRHYYLDGLTLQKLGALLGIHTTTAFRRLERIRARLLERTRAKVRAQLRVPEAELTSLMRLLDDSLDMSFSPLAGSH